MHFIALLRAINVGGNSSIRMAELRKLGESLGFSAVKTLLQSGNMVFDAREADTTVLERQWETAVQEQLGVKTSFRIRSQKEWLELVAANPFRSVNHRPGAPRRPITDAEFQATLSGAPGRRGSAPRSDPRDEAA